MDHTAIIESANFLSGGGIAAVIFLLLLIILGLAIDRFRLLKRIDKMTDDYLQSKSDENETIQKIINTYHEGNISLVQSLVEIKSVLISIQSNRR